MSARNMTWVMYECDCVSGDRLVLMVMADSASDENDACWLSVGNIAARARLSHRQTQRCLRNLEADGYIKPMGKDKSGTTVYAFQKGGRQIDTPVVDDGEGVSSTTSTGGVNDTQTKEPTEPKKKSEPLFFDEWVEHHSKVTDRRVPLIASKNRKDLAARFSKMLGEGYVLEDFKRASSAVANSEWHKDNGQTDYWTVLRHIDQYIE